MRAIRSLTLLLALVAPAAFADTQYQVEMFLVRQNAVPAIISGDETSDTAASGAACRAAAKAPLCSNTWKPPPPNAEAGGKSCPTLAAPTPPMR